MMHPLLRYSFKAGIWYQGESNDNDPVGYSSLLKDLIRCWRKWFGDKLPFLFVQLPSYDDPGHLVNDQSWAIIREEQRMVSEEVKGTAMAVTIDNGESNDLHPQTKDVVGSRLAVAAESVVYGGDEELCGPLAERISYMPDEGTVRVMFSHCTGGIKLVNNNADYFEAGYIPKFIYNNRIGIYDDRILWHKATGVIGLSACEIEVKLPVIDYTEVRPVAIRYAWSCAPEFPPLYNGVELPATPFAVLL